MKLVKLPSLAKDSDGTYYAAQVRLNKGTPSLHIQVGAAGDYTSGDFWISMGLWEWAVKQLSPDAPSMNHGGSKAVATKTYKSCRVRPEGTDRLRLQIEGQQFNRPYGACFIVPCPDLANVLSAVITAESKGGG